ncbi:DUF4258 domain-containing protein [Bifidobacterium callitrichos]|uniref:DUF4258 domain-containing protein n=1 Tax=Bifidobacterium callitrichos TaxID=762209 RepID=A0A5M9ZBM0_9BIFI|nr:DUF4258 domain-containing protein [Bifidobacterium callitrichos]KAA8815934.1 DUF4258 domain-containing protein [Bifidobacterium callitrichos]
MTKLRSCLLAIILSAALTLSGTVPANAVTADYNTQVANYGITTEDTSNFPIESSDSEYNTSVPSSENTESTPSARVAPILIWLGGIAVRLTAHAIQQMTARGISQQLVKQVLLNGVKSNANKGTWKYVMGRGKIKSQLFLAKRPIM